MKRVTMFISVVIVIITVFFIMSFNLHNCNGCIILRYYKPVSIIIVIITLPARNTDDARRRRKREKGYESRR